MKFDKNKVYVVYEYDYTIAVVRGDKMAVFIRNLMRTFWNWYEESSLKWYWENSSRKDHAKLAMKYASKGEIPWCNGRIYSIHELKKSQVYL